MTEAQLISGCLNNERHAQRLLYEQYAPVVFGICKRYMKDRERAEEMTTNSFLNIYGKISQYNGAGSFKGWLCRVAVNTCLMELRKKNDFRFAVEAKDIYMITPEASEKALEEEDIAKMLLILPDGARIIFNLYAMEGYKHSEIAEMLGISEGTSKSQLSYAKEKLRKTFFSQRTLNLPNHAR